MSARSSRTGPRRWRTERSGRMSRARSVLVRRNSSRGPSAVKWVPSASLVYRASGQSFTSSAAAGPASRSPSTMARTRPLLPEVNGLQVTRPDLVGPAGRLPVEGGGAAYAEGDRLALAQLHLGTHAVPL